MKPMDLLEAFGELPEEDIARALTNEPPRKRTAFLVSKPFLAGLSAAACLILTLGLVHEVWNRQEKIPAVIPLETTCTSVVQTQKRTETCPETTSQTTAAVQTTVSLNETSTITPQTTASDVSLSTTSTTVICASTSGTAAQTESITTQAMTTASVSTHTTFSAVTPDTPESPMIYATAAFVSETITETESLTTEIVPVTESHPPQLDAKEVVTASTGFFVSYCIGEQETQIIRFHAGADDPSDFTETYILDSDALVMQQGEVLFLDGKLCRVFMIEDDERGYELVQYRRCDFCYTCQPETGWEFRRFLNDIPSFFGIGENKNADGDCIWEDGLYVMYVQAPRDTAEQIVRGFRTEIEGQEELS